MTKGLGNVMAQTSSPRLRAAVLLTLVGGCGFVGGILAERLIWSGVASADPVEDTWPGPRAVIRSQSDDSARSGVRVLRLGFPEQLADELDLSAEQKAEIERILAEDQGQLRAAMEQLEPSFEAIVRRTRERIQQVLTEDQLELWRESPLLRLRGPGRGDTP